MVMLQNQNFVEGVLSQRFGNELQRVAARHGDGKTWKDMEGAATSAWLMEGENNNTKLDGANPQLTKP
jgi:hypothetical protein